MLVKFTNQENLLFSHDDLSQYKHLADLYLFFLKQQTRCELFYWKSAGVFALATFLFLILEWRGTIPNAWLGILIVGVGCLLIFTQNARMDFGYGIKAAACVEKGLPIEKKFGQLPKIFQIFEENIISSYRGHLLSRLLPIGLIGVITTGVGALWSAKVSVWLSGSLLISSIFALSLVARRYIKAAKKVFLKID